MVYRICSASKADFDNTTELDTDKSSGTGYYMGPENQLGLKSQYQFNLPWDNQVDEDISLEKECKSEYHEGDITYWDFT